MLCDCAFGILPCWKIIALSLFAGMVWTLLQTTLNLTVFRALAKSACGNTTTESDRSKLIQQLSELTSYSVMFCVGLAYIPYTPCFGDGSACWVNVGPVATINPEVLTMYIVQLSGYSQMLISAQLLR